MVLFNGFYMGRNLSGYAPFSFDVTDYVKYGGANVIMVRVDATLNSGWWYEGAGIYRHTWLTKTHTLHIAQWGTAVRSDPSCHEADKPGDTDVAMRSSFNGLCLALVQATDRAGTIHLEASAEGLPSADVGIKSSAGEVLSSVAS